MRGRAIAWILIWLFGSWCSAQAESTNDVMKAFGLVGTWSDDCSKDVTKEPGMRFTYEVPPSGPPTAKVIARINSQLVIERTFGIEDAVRVAPDEIQLIEKPLATKVSVGLLDPSINDRTQRIVLRNIGGNKHIVVDSRTVDGSHVWIENGRSLIDHTPARPSEQCQR